MSIFHLQSNSAPCMGLIAGSFFGQIQPHLYRQRQEANMFSLQHIEFFSFIK